MDEEKGNTWIDDRWPHLDLATDDLGFRLDVTIFYGDFPFAGEHVTYENEHGEVTIESPHEIKISKGLTPLELKETIGHEVYHLFYSIRKLITVDEETETEAFGELLRHIHEFLEQNENT